MKNEQDEMKYRNCVWIREIRNIFAIQKYKLSDHISKN